MEADAAPAKTLDELRAEFERTAKRATDARSTTQAAAINATEARRTAAKAMETIRAARSSFHACTDRASEARRAYSAARREREFAEAVHAAAASAYLSRLDAIATTTLHPDGAAPMLPGDPAVPGHAPAASRASVLSEPVAAKTTQQAHIASRKRRALDDDSDSGLDDELPGASSLDGGGPSKAPDKSRGEPERADALPRGIEALRFGTGADATLRYVLRAEPFLATTANRYYAMVRPDLGPRSAPLPPLAVPDPEHVEIARRLRQPVYGQPQPDSRDEKS